MEKPRLAFFGSGPFGRSILLGLISVGHSPVLVVTRPPSASGRGRVVSTDEVADEAIRLGLPLEQPNRLTADWLSRFHAHSPDLAIVAAYGKIIPASFLDRPRFGWLNVHPSLLPRYRGASPIAAAIANGDSETGVTIIKMDAGIDTGPIVAQINLPLDNKIRRPALESQLAALATQLLIKTLPAYLAGQVRLMPQASTSERPTGFIHRNSGFITWRQSSEQIGRLARAYDPWPGIWTKWNDQILKLLNVEPAVREPDLPPGTTFQTSPDDLLVRCGNGSIIVHSLQLSGRRPALIHDFLRGYPGIIGYRFPDRSS